MQSGTEQRIVIHTGIKPENVPVTVVKPKNTAVKHAKRRVGYSERLLRNTAIACTLLMGILAVRNVDQPWSEAAVRGIESALTMRIDPDASLGRLSFVQSLMPESTLVFFNMSGSRPLDPVSGEIIHEYTGGQPWTVFSCNAGDTVRSALAGTVSAVSCMESGDWCVMVDHGGGIETLYAYMDKPDVDAGDDVVRGQALGVALGDSLYYEYRIDGKSVAPGEEAEN